MQWEGKVNWYRMGGVKSTVYSIVGDCVQPLPCLLCCDIYELPVAVLVVLHRVVDRDTGVVLEYVDQLRVVDRPGRRLVVYRLELLVKRTSL